MTGERDLGAVQLRVEEAWEGGLDAVPLPPSVITPEGTFYADGRTPYDISDEQMVAAGWRKRWRIVSDWMDA